MNKRDLLQENEELRNENKRLLCRLGAMIVQLNETKRILELENSGLWNRVNNSVIILPSGRQLDINSLNLEQLEYLESLSNENINRM